MYIFNTGCCKCIFAEKKTLLSITLLHIERDLTFLYVQISRTHMLLGYDNQGYKSSRIINTVHGARG